METGAGRAATSVAGANAHASKAPRRGALYALRVWALGEPDQTRKVKRELKHALSHGAVLQGLGRLWAVPMVVMLGLAALVTLSAPAITHESALWRAGGFGALDPVDAMRIAATVVIVVGIDLALGIAATRMGDALARGEKLFDHWVDAGMIALNGGLETWTLALMFAGLESSKAMVLSQTMNVARALVAILTTVYLGSLARRLLNERDVTQLAGEKVSTLVLHSLDQLDLDETGLGDAYRVLALAQDRTLTFANRAAQLVPALEQLSPSRRATELAHYQQVARDALARAQAAEREAAEQVEATIAEAGEEAGRQLVAALLSVLTTGQVSEALAAQYPELHDLAGADLGKLGGGKGGKSLGVSGDSRRAPRTDAERQRVVLLEAGIASPTRPPKGKLGCWVSAQDVAALTDGKLQGETARKLVAALGTGAKSAGQLVARFGVILPDLAAKGLLSPRAQEAYSRYAALANLADVSMDASAPSGPLAMDAQAAPEAKVAARNLG